MKLPFTGRRAPAAGDADPAPKKKSKTAGKDPDLPENGFVEVWGEHVHMARYYRAFSVLLAVLLLLVGTSLVIISTRPDPLPIVVRVDEVGRAQVVDYNAGRATTAPDDPVVPYFLTQFVYDHYQRRRVIGTESWRRSLFFLRSDVAQRAVNEDRDEFVAFLSSSSDPEQLVENVQLRLIPQPEPPYAAEILFDLVDYLVGAELSRVQMVLSLRFVFAEDLDSSTILINPLGIVIIYMDEQVTIVAGGSG